MTTDPIETLMAAGFDADAARSRAHLLAQAESALRSATGAGPEWRWFVPGRIEVFGKHTDYAGGRSLLVAVPRGFAIVARPRPDGLVQVIDARYGQRATVDVSGTSEVAGWARYLAVVARRMAHNFPGAALGADLAIASDLPRAAGLSSSSALVVAIGTALIRRADLANRPEWRAAIQSNVDLAGYLGAVENGLTFGTLAGTSGVGTHGGSEDHTAIINCRPGQLSAYAYVPVRHLEDAPMPSDWRFVVATSGVEADKAGSAMARYNHASLATRALVDVWNRGSGASYPTLASALATSADGPSHLHALIERVPHPDFTAAVLRQRLAHFIDEDARVLPAAHAFRTADVAAIGHLSRASQHDADVLLGNQIEETRELARLARECGAFAASSFGAGFGGSVWALAEAESAAAFGERWTHAYRSRVTAPAPIEWFAVRPGPGVVELT